MCSLKSHFPLIQCNANSTDVDRIQGADRTCPTRKLVDHHFETNVLHQTANVSFLFVFFLSSIMIWIEYSDFDSNINPLGKTNSISPENMSLKLWPSMLRWCHIIMAKAIQFHRHSIYCAQLALRICMEMMQVWVLIGKCKQKQRIAIRDLYNKI